MSVATQCCVSLMTNCEITSVGAKDSLKCCHVACIVVMCQHVNLTYVKRRHHSTAEICYIIT